MAASSSKKDISKPSRILTLDEIDNESVNDIIQLIYEINDEDIGKKQVEPIKLIINSFGGEVYSGLALIDTIDSSSTPIYTICHGSAMSMALIVYTAGHQRYASKNATFMYHETAYPVEGKIIHHRRELKEVERIENICDSYLLSKTLFTKKQLSNIKKTQEEWYFNIETALELGVVNEIL